MGKTLLIILIVLFVLYCVFIGFFFFVDFDRKFKIPMEKLMNPDGVQEMYRRKDTILSWPMQEVRITSYDGLQLYGRYFHQSDSKRLLIMCHGWKSKWYADFSTHVLWFYENQCDLLIIDERACGESEGRFVTFGIKERRDIAAWAEWASRNQKLPVYLYGTSMGAASVLMSADLSSDFASGIVADSPFTQPYTELRDFAKRMLHIPEYPFLPSLNLLCRLILKEDLRHTDAEEILKKSRIPVIIFHGAKDWFCSVSMSERVRDMNLPNVDTYIYDDCGHCGSYTHHEEEYKHALMDLFSGTGD